MHWIDPDSLPETVGEVELFVLNPRGEADGLILAGGQEIHFPPHMGREIVAALGAARSVRVRGVRPRGAPVIAALAVDFGDVRVRDHGPPAKTDEPRRLEKAESVVVEGVVRQPLHGPRGERRGILLTSGTVLRFPPHAAEAVADLLTPGGRIAAEGERRETSLGVVVEAKKLGAAPGEWRVVAGPPGPPPPKPKKAPHRPADARHP